MNSKERLLKCINHEPIDRVPISTYELVGWNEDAWENNDPSYKKLMDNIREYTDCIYMTDPAIIYPKKDNEIVKTWREQDSNFIKKTIITSGSELSMLIKETDGVHTQWITEHLLDEIDDIDKYLSIPFEEPTIDYTRFDKEKDKLGNKGIMMASVPDPIAEAAELFGMSKFLIYAVLETEKIKYFMDALHERQMCVLDKILSHDMTDTMVRIYGPEYGAPPYLSKEYFDIFVYPYLKKMCSKIKEAGAIPRIHSHGNIATLLDDFARTDADVLEPVEPIPDGDIPLKEIKKQYGDRFCLMGNIELKELEFSDTRRIDQLVKTAMESGKEGSGFILMPTAAPINTPLKKKTEGNYIQMIESAIRYGKY